MKARILKLALGGTATVLAAAIVTPSLAQVPPELFGGGEVAQDDLDKRSFYESPEGTWFQSSPKDQSGLGCIVSFLTAKQTSKDGEVTLGDTFGIMGPNSAKTMEAGAGLVIFTGPRIPPRCEGWQRSPHYDPER